MLAWLKRDRRPRRVGIYRQGMYALPDELVVEILSRLPLKSICRFKCVCQYWLAITSDSHYRQKLPRTPAGLLYKKRELGRLLWSLRPSIHLARLPTSDTEINTRCNFMPAHYKYSNLEDCSNGLLLSYHGVTNSGESFDAIVCNPATQKWLAIPDTKPGPLGYSTDLRLCFDPLWSQHFYIFQFRSIRTFGPNTHTTQVKVFFSEDSIWSNCLWESKGLHVDESLFINGVMYLWDFRDVKIQAFDAPDTNAQWLNHKIIRLPGCQDMCTHGCLGQSSGDLCYAKLEIDGCMVRIWGLEGLGWVVKHDVSMTDVFGRDKLLSSDWIGDSYFDYVDILAFDLEREIVILNDKKGQKIILVSTSTGKLSRFRKVPRKFTKRYRTLFYVPYYGEIPA
ncbi:unnamed protein product [Alopecurus aequalis]